MPRFVSSIIITGLLSMLGNHAYAEVVVVVSNNSSISRLTSLQLTDIYLGRLTQLPEGSAILPLDQSEQTAAHNEFYRQYIGRTPAQIRSHWSRLIFTGRGQPPKAVGGNAAMVEALNRNVNAIGYVESEAVTDGIRIVDIEP